MADIPGLIEGASDGVGLGHEFLRHVERAGLLVHLVEPMPIDSTDPVQNYNSIRSELCEYDASLGERDEIVVVTKSELEGAADVRDALAQSTGDEVLLISAMTGDGLQGLMSEIMSRVDRRRKLMIEAGEEITVLRESDLVRTPAQQGKRLPPHLAGPTQDLSDEVQAKDFDSPSQPPKAGGDNA
jgi:GTP-binding protein